MDTNKIYVILDDNSVVKAYSCTQNEIYNILVETSMDLDNIDLVDSYKLVDMQLVELTETEKASLISTPKPTEIDILKEQTENLNNIIDSILTEIIPSLMA
jgi:hypothetical protein